MSSGAPRVELVLLWHHHQPDYRSPESGRAELPWVRLHATKDYLDMARRLARFPGVRATFNFVPTLIDQLEAAARGGGDALFDLLRRPPRLLTPAERGEVIRRCAQAPPHAVARWPAYRALIQRAADGGRPLDDAELVALECWFLLAWLDPMFHAEPDAARAIAGTHDAAARDRLLALHDRLTGEVLDAYRAIAASGQVELSATPYHHPILPLLLDGRVARRAQPALALPDPPFAAPEDARRHVERALARHAQTFGAPPAGMWPAEGGVSPEAVELLAGCGVRWLATDDGVLRVSRGPDAPRTDARAWRFDTAAGPMLMLFRDHELSDRVGFVYQRWEARAAVADFLARLRRRGTEHEGPDPALVCVMLDGENCWEGYPEDGGPFLDALYGALEAAPDVRTTTPAALLERLDGCPRLERLHSGSWIDANFHIWIGHPEKNRAWELLARTRAALVAQGRDASNSPEAWEALARAEGSDWFWWLGEDHYSSDKAIFDRLFRAHLQAAHRHAGLEPPAALERPIAAPPPPAWIEPTAFMAPVIDGTRTHFYEWAAAGRARLDAAGSSAHRSIGAMRELFVGFDRSRLFLRLDFNVRTGAADSLVVDLGAAAPGRLRIGGLAQGSPHVTLEASAAVPQALPGADARLGQVLELAVSFEALGLAPGQPIELSLQLWRDGQPAETWPEGQGLRLAVPDTTFPGTMWTV